MATIEEVRLNVGKEYNDGQSLVHDVTVEVDIRWSRTDRLSGQPFEATYALWAADASVNEPASDQLMLRGTNAAIVRSVNGAQTDTLTVVETFFSGQLNEDGPGSDEAFAVVTLDPLRPTLRVEAQSDIVSYLAPQP